MTNVFNSYNSLTCSRSERTLVAKTAVLLMSSKPYFPIQQHSNLVKAFRRDFPMAHASREITFPMEPPVLNQVHQQLRSWENNRWEDNHFRFYTSQCDHFAVGLSKAREFIELEWASSRFLVLFDSIWWVDVDRTSAWMNFNQNSINPWVIRSTPVWLRINGKTIFIGLLDIYITNSCFPGCVDRFWLWQNDNSPNFQRKMLQRKRLHFVSSFFLTVSTGSPRDLVMKLVWDVFICELLNLCSSKTTLSPPRVDLSLSGQRGRPAGPALTPECFRKGKAS